MELVVKLQKYKKNEIKWEGSVHPNLNARDLNIEPETNAQEMALNRNNEQQSYRKFKNIKSRTYFKVVIA